MKKMLALTLLMSLMTMSCDKSDGDSSSEESTQTISDSTSDEAINNGDDSETDTEVSTPTPEPGVPALALSFGSNVELFDFTTPQESKYNQAITLVKKVVATEAFRTRILGHTYNGVKQFADNRGRTNSQIYQSILDAAETLRPQKNNIMDLGVKLYYEDNNVVGYTYSSITYINVNTKFFNTYRINEVAANLFHEWLHKLGYGHDASATTKRPYSVPYAIGYIIRDIGKNFL